MKNRLFPMYILAAVWLILSLTACSLPFDFGNKSTLPQVDPLPPDPTAYTGAVAVPTESSSASPVKPGASPFRDDPAWSAARIRAAGIWSGMSENERIFQLFMVCPEALTTEKNVTVFEGWELKYRPAGAVVLQADNLESREQTAALLQGYQGAAHIPLFLAVSEEGGRLSPLARKLGTVSLGNMYSFRGDGTAKAYENARLLSAALQENRFNMNLAPVADVWSVPDIKTAGTRAFSDSFEKAADLISSAVNGYEDSGMLCTLKYFPGSGEAVQQADGTFLLNKHRSELEKEEWLPFRSGIQAGAEFVMAGNILVPDLDPAAPAPFSSVILSLLRNGMDFEGIILADGLLTDTDEESARNCVRALAAGCDMLYCPAHSANQLDYFADTIKEALKDGTLTEDRLQECVIRILSIKIYRGLIQ